MICFDCCIDKNELDFPINGNNRRNKCRDCFNHQRRYYYHNGGGKVVDGARARRNRPLSKKKIREEIDGYKEKNCCVDCLNYYPHYVMDFDHLIREDKFENISKMTNSRYSSRAIKEEMKKCNLVCANCHRIREYNRAQENNKFKNKNEYRNKHREYVNEIKNIPCCDCSKILIPWAMDLDHRRRDTKIMAVSGMVGQGWSLENIKNEIIKCDVICANCHRIRTHIRNDYRKLEIK